MLNLKFFKNKKIFITGHTGFKGSWLSYILYLSGAKVTGYSLKPKNKQDNFYLLKLDSKIKNYYSDIRNEKNLKNKIKKCKPDIIFHLAAQPLVKESYRNPKFTFSTNIIGTLNILEAVRDVKSVKSVSIITSDKCYKNYEKSEGYSEQDELGGEDPYSASKAAAENIFYSYSKSFFKNKNKIGLVSVRAGNVIGGGDWSQDRIIPDLIKSIILKKKFTIRSPKSTRPWQHVLEAIWGYLLLASNLKKNRKLHGEAFNFGPITTNNYSVLQVVKIMKKNWEKVSWKVIDPKKNNFYESSLLKLNSNKAEKKIKSVMIIDIDNKSLYKKNLDIIRYKRDVAEGVNWVN